MTQAPSPTPPVTPFSSKAREIGLAREGGELFKILYLTDLAMFYKFNYWAFD